MKSLSFALLLGAAALALLWRWLPWSETPRLASAEFAPPAATAQDAALLTQGFIFEHAVTAMVHSGSLTELADGSLLAAWFGGSREGAQDVAIYAARQHQGAWSPPFIITDRASSARELGRYIRKLGNPVLLRDMRQRLWLFYVTVSIGGWSTSAIAYKTSDDAGKTWSAARRLVSSPFFNLSTLVRARPALYADGSIALPVYHELAGKFGELLRIGPAGQVLGKARMGSGRSAIQPSLLITDSGRALALLRRSGRSPYRIMLAASDDGGLSWSTPEATELPNPDASVAALSGYNGVYLLVYNPSEQGRNRLSLATSDDGRTWRKRADFANSAHQDEFSYPYLIRGSQGDYHLIYTWRRKRMAYVHFNQAWLERRP